MQLDGPAPIREAFTKYFLSYLNYADKSFNKFIKLQIGCHKSRRGKEALLNYVSEQCCYGKTAAKDLTITNVQYSSAFQV